MRNSEQKDAGVDRVARFFSIQTYQNAKNILDDHKPKQTAIIPNGRKIFLLVIKYQGPPKFTLNWDLGYENRLSVWQSLKPR
jgi:hypothetical protein